MTRLAMIHTVGRLEPLFADLAAELAPDVETTHVVDEDLLGEAIAAGRVPEATAARLEETVDRALQGGADLVLVTCSSMGRVVDAMAARGTPVVRVDEALADRAIELGARIGVIATLATTLEPTADLVRRRADVAGREPGLVSLVTRVVDGAFDALKAGDLETHDELVRAGLRELLPLVDVIVLAQASMARVAATLDAEDTGDTPILASPRLGVERAMSRLLSGGPEDAGAGSGG
jgi:Asp/Glu/hydantoin racemase